MSDLAAALGRIPSGLFVLTMRSETNRAAMLASWVMQASFQPPMITVAVNKERGLAPFLRPGTALALSILPEDDRSLLSRLARPGRPEDNLEGLELLPEENGHAPVLACALGFVAGRVVGSLETGDHTVFSVELDRGRLLNEGRPAVHVRNSGARY